MMLPVSSYEELLARVRSLTNETIQLRHEITTSLQASPFGSSTNSNYDQQINHSNLLPRPSLSQDMNATKSLHSGVAGGNTEESGSFFDKKGNETDNEYKEIDEKHTSPDIPYGNGSFHRNGWSPDTLSLWHSGPSSLNLGPTSSNYAPVQDLTLSVTSNSHGPHSIGSFSSSSKRTYSHQQLGAKVEMVYNLLSMLDTDNREDMSKTFLAMSSSAESCHSLRQSGCLPLLIQLIHSYELNKEVRKRAAEALHNIVHAQTDEKRRRREVRVLKLLEELREYCDELKNDCTQEASQSQESEKHPISAIGTLMKFSFDAEHRQAICVLGGLHAVTQLLQVDHEVHGSTNEDSNCITLRRYAGMSLTNLTFGDGRNKALLCSFNKFMRALVDQLKSESEDLRQVTASVLRNLSWRADSESKQALRNVGAVTALTVSAMEGKKESTLKSILSALWNLSAHCSLNKIDICSVPGALAFLVKMLRYKSSSNTLSVVENAGGILRNVSSHIAVREDYRQILRDNNCFEVLLEQLKSPSLTVVSNACGTLWNLSARCSEDQKRLWDMGATTMLRSLVQSKHKMISMGSSAALKNLLSANPNENLLTHLDSTAKSLGLQNLPTLFVRKKKALEQELNITLAETCDNIDVTGSPTHFDSSVGKVPPKRSESRDSVQSTQSDSVYERINQITLKNEEKVLENKNITLHESLDEKSMSRKIEDQKLVKRYKSSMIPTPTFKKMNQDRINEKTKEENDAEDKAKEAVKVMDSKGREFKQRNKNGIPVSDTKNKGRESQNYGILDKNNSLQTSDKYLEANLEDKCHQTPNSQTQGEFIESNKFYSSLIQVDEATKSRECNSQNNNEQCRENIMFLNDEIPSTEICNAKAASANTKFFGRINADCRNKVANETHESVNTREITDVVSSKENFPQRCFLQTPVLKDGNQQHEEIIGGVVSSTQADVEEPESEFFSFRGANKDLMKSKIPESSSTPGNSKLVFPPGSAEDTRESFLETDCESKNQLYPNDNLNGDSEIFPKFKVGSPITDSSILKMEAKKICREIKKQQDFDMGCSLTSEVSLISCSSFLDTGDYSLFDSSTDAIDFENSENLLLGKSCSKMKSFPFRKSNVSPAAESISLPSLGSLKYDQLDNLDLDSSVLSVASITSEVAETNLKDFEVYDTFGHTYKKIESEKEIMEETIADATLVSEGDETLNADPLQNEEFFEEDNSLHSQESLPLDQENSQLERTTDPMNKKLTPKEKRKTFQDRYKTYTIRNFQDNELSRQDVVSNFQGANAEAPIGYTRESNKLIWNNCKLGKCNFDQKNETEQEIQKSGREVADFSSKTFLKGNKYDKLYFSKSFDKERNVGPNFVFDSRSLTNLLSIGPAERKELVDNAKLVAFSLKTAIREGENISDSEGEDDYKSVEIDTATFSKSNRDRFLRSQELRSLEPYERDTTEEDPEKKVARITKPNSNEDEKLEFSKGIRGRRKPLYSSPRKNSSQATDSPFNSPKMSKVGKKPLKDTISSPVLHREGTFTKEDVPDLKRVEAKTLQTTPSLQKNFESKGVNFSRPPNKNKAVPSAENSKRGGENQVSRIGRPLSSYASKNSERRAESDPSQRRPLSGPGNRIVGGKTGSSVKSVSTGLPTPKMRNSSSNQNIKAGNNTGSGLSCKSRNLALQSSKSQSDASIDSVASKDRDVAGTERTPKREVTSKIACLWRKVEETKQRNQNLKDNRVWICPEKKTDVPDEVLVVEKEEILDIPTRKIVRSYTCQALPDETPTHFCSQESDLKNSGEYLQERDLEERGKKTERRNIISAVIPPFNYNPPVSTQVLSSTIKEVDPFLKGSLKITTV